MALARDGSDDAAREIYDQYQPHVIRVVRRRLRHELRSKFDSVDFAQAVWQSFFSRRIELTSVDNPESFVKLLAIMTRNKILDETRRRTRTQKYDVSKELPLDTLPTCANERDMAQTDTPSEFAIANERWTGILRNSPQRNQSILKMKMSGLTCQEIADELDLSERTVRRAIKKMDAEDSAPDE